MQGMGSNPISYANSVTIVLKKCSITTKDSLNI